MNRLIFVYGTLKRGCCNHSQLAGQAFVGEARTQPGFRLFDLGGYPGIVANADDRDGVFGEVWSVDPDCLDRLDAFEGVHEGLYHRVPLPLAAPFHQQQVDAYVSPLPVTGRPEVGSTWTE